MRRIETGFTLIELLVTISVIAIVASIALPSMKNLMVNVRMNQAAETIKNALEQARTDSFTTHKAIDVSITGNAVAVSVPYRAPTAGNTGNAGTDLGGNEFERQMIYLPPSVVVAPQSAVAGGVRFARGVPQSMSGAPLGQSQTCYKITYDNEPGKERAVRIEGLNTIKVLKDVGECV